jgi:hypothetical protein
MPASPARWLTGLAYAKAYRKAHGHLAVPHDWRTEDGLELGSWIHVQRREFRDGTLSAERRQHGACTR